MNTIIFNLISTIEKWFKLLIVFVFFAYIWINLSLHLIIRGAFLLFEFVIRLEAITPSFYNYKFWFTIVSYLFILVFENCLCLVHGLWLKSLWKPWFLLRSLYPTHHHLYYIKSTNSISPWKNSFRVIHFFKLNIVILVITIYF